MKGRPVLGAISGFLFGTSLALLLIVAGALPLNSILVTLMPFIGLVVGLVLAGWAPLRRRSSGQATEPRA